MTAHPVLLTSLLHTLSC